MEFEALRTEQLRGDPAALGRDAIRQATQSVRRWRPDFEPEYDSEFFH